MSRLRTLCLSALFALSACSGGGPEGTAPKKEEAKAEAAKTAPTVAAPAAELPKAEALLAEVVEASGGAAKLDAIKSYRSEAKVEIVGMGISGIGIGWWKDGDFYNEADLPGVGRITAGSKGGKPWTSDPVQGLRALTGKEAEMALAGASLNLAHDWRRYFDKAETTEVREVGGKKIADVKLSSSKAGHELTLKIDLADKRVVGRTFKQPSPMGDMPVEEVLSDYREQDGVWFSFQQLADMKLQKMQTTTTKLELNPAGIDESKFAMPGSEAPPPDAKAPAGAKK